MNLAQCKNLPLRPLTGTWYRAIQPQHYLTSLQTKHTRSLPSRFSGGSAGLPWYEILYLAENQLVALQEVQALFGSPVPGKITPAPKQPRVVFPVDVVLQDIVDLANPSEQKRLSVSVQELTGDWEGYRQRHSGTPVTGPTGFAPTQILGRELFQASAVEGFHAVSAKATCFRNLVIFPEKLQRGSSVTFTDIASGSHHVIKGTVLDSTSARPHLFRASSAQLRKLRIPSRRGYGLRHLN
jgi:RES domain-containing protein